MLNRPQVLGVHHVSAVLVLFNRHEAARTLAFFHDVNLGTLPTFFTFRCGLLHQDIARSVDHARLGFVVPAAGIGATALIRIAVVKVARQQATPRIGNAQRAVHKHLQLRIRALLANLRHLVQ